MNKLLLMAILFTFCSCGGEPRTKRTGTGNNSSFNGNTPLQNPISDYSFEKCGTIQYEQGLTGGSTGHFLYQNNGSKFNLIAIGTNSQNILNSISTSSSACVYSNTDAQQGYEGLIFNAEQIVI
jgi:hypothetical protein